jgi:hypothetical protein
MEVYREEKGPLELRLELPQLGLADYSLAAWWMLIFPTFFEELQTALKPEASIKNGFIQI